MYLVSVPLFSGKTQIHYFDLGYLGLSKLGPSTKLSLPHHLPLHTHHAWCGFRLTERNYDVGTVRGGWIIGSTNSLPSSKSEGVSLFRTFFCSVSLRCGDPKC